MTTRHTALSGIAAVVVFWCALLIFGALDSSYSHATRAVSELGMAGAPHQWAWNTAGFILPGLLVATFGVGMGAVLSPGGRVASALLIASGVSFAATGVFAADMADMTSFSTRAHIWTSVASLLFWLPAPILVAIAARRRSMTYLIAPSIVGLVVLLAGVMLGQAFLSRGYAQRLNFGTYFGWVLVMALSLWMRGTPATTAPPPSVSARN